MEPEHKPQMADAAAAGEPAVGGEDDHVFFVALHYKGTAYEVPVQAEDGIASIFDFAQEALDFPRENCKLISRGKMLRPDHESLTIGEAGLQAGSKLMLVASSAHDVDFVRSSRPDPLVKGFAEEERDEASRRKRTRAAQASSWGTKQDQEYRFNSIKAEFKYSEPPPFEAEKLLQRLSTDPGIIDIMKSRRFTVGILTEMSPVEAQERMAKRGTPNMDLLGYNQNAGEMIVLRLRTDSLKGFRPYHDLINTLIHELTHNVWGPHDQNFWKLYGELKAQYMRFHRFWSHNGKSADGSGSSQFQGFTGGDSDDEGEGGGFGRALGSGEGDGASPKSRASRAAMAAEARAAMGEGPDQPPKRLNFLSGDGKWVLVCPCGQVHDPADCEIAQAAAASDTAATAEVQDAAAEMDEENAATTDVAADDEPMPQADSDPSSSSAGAPAATVSAAEAPTGPPLAATAATEAEGGDAPMEGISRNEELIATQAPAATEIAPPSTPPIIGSVDDTAPVESGGGAVSSSAAAASPADGDDLGLDLAELEAQGLDGASLWLARFSQRLRALAASRGGAARTAVELLLRLVRNVMSSPYEPKFRRVRADNPKIRAGLLEAGAEAEALMAMLGFEPSAEADGIRVFVLRDAALDVVRLQLGKELLERELEGAAVSAAVR